MIIWRDLLSRVHGLHCADGTIAECSSDRSRCKENAGMYLGHEFPTCPIRATMNDEALMFVLSLESQMEIAPISGWPDNYAAWVVDLISAIKEIRNQKTADEMKRARNG